MGAHYSVTYAGRASLDEFPCLRIVLAAICNFLLIQNEFSNTRHRQCSKSKNDLHTWLINRCNEMTLFLVVYLPGVRFPTSSSMLAGKESLESSDDDSLI